MSDSLLKRDWEKICPKAEYFKKGCKPKPKL